MTDHRSRIAKRLKRATELDYPYPFRPQMTGKDAAVLLLVSWDQNSQDLQILITRRTDHLETHKGQYAFPGGMKDAEDEGFGSTALRETKEEVGISEGEIELIGTLPDIWTPSGFLIHPWVGLSRGSIEKTEIRENPHEIDFVFWVSLSELKSEGVYAQEFREFLGRTVAMDVFQVREHRIWGATAAILKNFIGRLDQLGLE